MPDQTQAETERLQRQNDIVPVAAGDMAGASKALQSREEAIKHYMKMQGYDDSKPKDEKGFIESFKNAFTFSGAKEALGLNNQEVARLAVMTLGGRIRGYNLGHSLAFAGKQAFIESSKRQAQEGADKKAAMRNAVTMAQQDERNKQVDARAAAKEDHDKFIAEQQLKLAELKDKYQRDRDDTKYLQQLQILAKQQEAADQRLARTLGHQESMVYLREGLRANSPQAILERRAKNVDAASSAVSGIMDSELGSDNIKGQANPNRKGLPVPKEIGQQTLSFLKNAGVDVDNTDVYQESTALINQATRDMIAYKKANPGVTVTSITPFLARNVVTHRMGASKEDFMIGDKEMPPSKIAEVYGNISNKVKAANGGVPDDRKVSELVSAVRAEWQGPNGKKLRQQYTGNDNETAFYQYLNSKFK